MWCLTLASIADCQFLFLKNYITSCNAVSFHYRTVRKMTETAQPRISTSVCLPLIQCIFLHEASCFKNNVLQQYETEECISYASSLTYLASLTSCLHFSDIVYIAQYKMAGRGSGLCQTMVPVALCGHYQWCVSHPRRSPFSEKMWNQYHHTYAGILVPLPRDWTWATTDSSLWRCLECIVLYVTCSQHMNEDWFKLVLNRLPTNQ